jgi:hypothetical protein
MISILPLLANGEEVIRIARLDSGRALTPHPIDPALEIVTDSLKHVRSNVDDYSALFVKRCRVNGVLPPLQFARVKIRNRKNEDDQIRTPFSVYLDFLKPSDVKGREVIWIEDANDGDMVVHQGGMASFLTLNIDPEGTLAMRGQRYSVKEVGIEKLLEKIISTGYQDRQHGECDVKIHHDKAFGKINCTVLEITHPIRRDHFRFHRAVVYFDNNLRLPIRYQAWTWPESPGGTPVLDEEYSYFRLQVNVGLSDTDFDPANPDYRFR